MSIVIDGAKGISYDSPVGIPGGRLTLTTLTPIMTATVAAATTIFYTPYLGALIPIYDGALFRMQVFSELSCTTTDVTKNPTAIGASQNHDWYVWDDNGTLRLSHGPAWSTDVARGGGIGLIRVNGIYVNQSAITNACAAQRGTYVGTTHSNASSQLNWIFPGSSAGGTAGIFGVWNYYNRVAVQGMVNDATDWTYNAATIRPLNNSANNRISAVLGLAEEPIDVDLRVPIAGAAGIVGITGIGLNSTTAYATGAYSSGIVSQASGATASARWTGQALGFNFFQALEQGGPGTAVSFFGVTYKNGMVLTARM